jgi:predicted RNA-binding Zn-ribbon protein involved in translation (DUF1610 family)
MKQPTKPNKYKDIITIGSEWTTGEDRPIYYCDNCHCTLVRLSDSNNQNESYYCNRCSVEYPDATNIRQQLKISVPDRNIEPTVATTPGIPDISIHHTPEPKGTFKVMQQKVSRLLTTGKIFPNDV